MDQVTTELTIANDKMAANFSGSPIDCADYPNSVALKTEIKQAKGEWKVKGLFDVSTPDFSGAQFG